MSYGPRSIPLYIVYCPQSIPLYTCGIGLLSESAFDAHGRPLEPAFYSGFPAYHNLIYQIYQMGQRLDSQPAAVEDRQEVGVATSAPPQVWVKRKTLANIIAEELSDKQVSQHPLAGVLASGHVQCPPLPSPSTRTWCLVWPAWPATPEQPPSLSSWTSSDGRTLATEAAPPTPS